MKNTISIFCMLLALGTFAHAQTGGQEEAPIGTPSFGVYAGVNLQNINGKDANGDKLTNSLVIGYHFGVNYEFPIGPDFYLQPGVQFAKKGTKGLVPYANSGDNILTREIQLNYLEVPLNFLYKPVFGPGRLILGFGPYVGYAISGKALFEGTDAPPDADIDFQASVPDSDPNNLIYFKRMDVGGNFFVGYELQNGISASLTTQLGLININSDNTTQLTNKNTGFGLALAYRF